MFGNSIFIMKRWLNGGALALAATIALGAGDARAQDGVPEPPFHEVFAPRAALYESLPGFVLRLEERGPTAARLRLPGIPARARLTGGWGSYAPERASVGAEYDFKRLSAEAGLDAAFGDSLTGSVSALYVQGSAEVDSPVGGGEIDARGVGLALGASWNGGRGYYVAVRASLTDYGMEVSSEKRGLLKKDAGALAHSVGLEAGRRFELNERVSLTPRAWMDYSAVSAEEFTDAVDSRVSSPDAERLTGGLGVGAETTRAWTDGTLSLRGTLDVAQTLGGAETLAVVSGTGLSTEPARTRVLLSLGVAWRRERFSLGAGFSAGGLGSDDTHYSGEVHFTFSF